MGLAKSSAGMEAWGGRDFSLLHSASYTKCLEKGLFRSRPVTCWVLEKFQWIDGKMGTRSLLWGADTTYSSSFSGVPAFTVPIQVQGRLLLHFGVFKAVELAPGEMRGTSDVRCPRFMSTVLGFPVSPGGSGMDVLAHDPRKAV